MTAHLAYSLTTGAITVKRDAPAYAVIDTKTCAVVARCKTRAGASRSADKRDLEHGAIRYRVQRIA